MFCVLDVAVPQTGIGQLTARALSIGLYSRQRARSDWFSAMLKPESNRADACDERSAASHVFPECLNPLVRHSRSSSVARSSSAPRSSGAKRSPLFISLKIFRRCCYATFQFYILQTWSRSRSVAGFHLFPIPIPIAPHLGSLSRFASFPSKFPPLPIPNLGSFPTPPS